jgi:hypothetical protein
MWRPTIACGFFNNLLLNLEKYNFLANHPLNTHCWETKHLSAKYEVENPINHPHFPVNSSFLYTNE